MQKTQRLGTIMTLPDERYRSVELAREFLYDLGNASKTPKVPRAVRERAWAVLRHFPTEWEMEQVSEKAPDVFQKERQHLYNFVKRL